MADEEKPGMFRRAGGKAKGFFSRKPKEDPEEEKLEEAELGEVPLERARAKAEIKYYKAQAKAARKGGGGYGGKKPRSILKTLLFIGIFIGILYLVWIFVVSPLAGEFVGTYAAEELGSEAVKTEARFANILAPFEGAKNAIKQTLTIETQEWDSQELHSGIIINPDAGVTIRDLGAPRDFFTDEDIEITGTLDAISTFAGEDVILTIDVKSCDDLIPDPVCKTDEKLKDKWDCELFGEQKYETGMNSFKVSNINSRRFTCIHEEINAPGTYMITFEFRHNSRAVITKNLFVTDTQTFMMHENLAEAFDIRPEETRGYLASDGRTIDFSMGLARVSKQEFLKNIFTQENPADAFIPAAVAGEETSVHNQYLGVAFKSKDYSSEIEVHGLTITLPSTNVNYISKGSQFYIPDEEKPYALAEGYPLLQDYIGKDYVIETVPAGESRVYYLKFYVKDDYLGGSKYDTLTAQANIDYDYIRKETITVEVKELPAS